MSQRLPAPLLAYRAATSLIGPLAAPAWLKWRLRHGKEDEDRLPERYGFAARERPEGELVWAHGASVGETMALLPVIGALVTGSKYGRRFMCGTVEGQGNRLIVSAGLGTSRVPLRLGAPPDIWLISLEPAQSTQAH